MSIRYSPRSYYGAPSTRMMSTRGGSVAHIMTAEEVDEMIDNFTKEDVERDKTWSRIVVENCLSKYRWYFPRKDVANGPSLSKAYAYYEHITLPRRFVGEQTADHVLRRADAGETETTELYSPVTTPSSSFIEWGVGMDLYFSTLRIMAVTLLVAGFISLALMLFYQSEEYSPKGKPNVTFSLLSSAVCETDNWVVCSDCWGKWGDDEERNRFGQITEDGQDLPVGTVLVLGNGCKGVELAQGMINYGTGVFLTIAIAIISLYLRAREVRFEEDKITSADYTVLIRNPPPDARDPDEWESFFSQFADKQVTFVTLALNNQELLEKLIARRYHRRSLRLMLPRGTDLDDEDVVRSAVAQLIHDRETEPRGCLMKIFDCTAKPILNLFNMMLPPQTLVDKIFTLTEEIKELQKRRYDVTTVFVSFETEEGQRSAMSALAAGKLDIMANNKANTAPGAVFGDKLLKVEEPAEPSSIRYLDLSSSKWFKIGIRLINLGVTVGIIVLAGLAVGRTRSNPNLGARWSGVLVAIFNSIIPQIVKLLMIFERHSTEGSYQASLYLKITIFRWINTAILTKLITPFTSTVSPGKNDVLPLISAILWSELFFVPGLRLLDLWGNVKKHFLAPRARNQELMNMNFTGTFYNLGERYTDLTKILFVCFFYSALFPASFFFGFAILTLQYYSDKYCLMRIWSWTPRLGSELARFSRRYFFSGALVAFVLVSAYAWAQFPYDNLCHPENPDTVPTGSYDVTLASTGENKPVNVTQDTTMQFCYQSWVKYDGFPFPPTARLQPEGLRWMTASQEMLTSIYGWTSVVVVVVFIVGLFGSALTRFFVSWFRGVYEPRGQNQHIDFSTVQDIAAYVPQIKKTAFPFPFLACNIDQIDQSLVGWKDPAHSYDYHNLIFDVPWEGMPRQKRTKAEEDASQEMIPGDDEASIESIEIQPPSRPIFSIVKHYPPEWRKKEIREAKK